LSSKNDLQPWRVLSSKTIIEDEWVHVRADECETAEGEKISPYYVFQYPDWVTVAALSNAQELLIIEQYRHGLGQVCVELPGGRVDKEDGEPLVTEKRELLEETGCRCQQYTFLGSYSPNPATHTNVDHFFLGTGCELVAHPELDSGEAIHSRFVSIEEAFSLIENGNFQQGRQISTFLMGLIKLGLLKL